MIIIAEYIIWPPNILITNERVKSIIRVAGVMCVCVYNLYIYIYIYIYIHICIYIYLYIFNVILNLN